MQTSVIFVPESNFHLRLEGRGLVAKLSLFHNFVLCNTQLPCFTTPLPDKQSEQKIGLKKTFPKCVLDATDQGDVMVIVSPNCDF